MELMYLGALRSMQEELRTFAVLVLKSMQYWAAAVICIYAHAFKFAALRALPCRCWQPKDPSLPAVAITTVTSAA